MRKAKTICRSLVLLASFELIIHTVGVSSPLSAEEKSNDKLTVADFQTIHTHLVKMSRERVWSIPWRLSVRDARVAAAKESKPVFLWISGNGGTHPLGPC